MINKHIFNFTTSISATQIPEQLNNPFGPDIPEIAKIAAKEFQEFIKEESKIWEHDFVNQKGKMFGVLVVQNEDYSFGYLGAVSGKIPKKASGGKFVPSIFDDSTGDFFINIGMSELTDMGQKIKMSDSQTEIDALIENRKLKSLKLQQKLFENYRIVNRFGIGRNVLQIFEDSSHGNPPSAAGECAAPKLLQFAFKNKCKPIAIAEFWWGNSPKNKEREHSCFYPACKNKCRPILEYMLEDKGLFEGAN